MKVRPLLSVRAGLSRLVKLAPIALLASACAAQKPPPTALPACGALYRGQRITLACTEQAKRALDDPDTSQLDHWRAQAALVCPEKGVISNNNDEVSFECIYALQKVGEFSPRPWWLRPFDPLIAVINWSLRKSFQIASPWIAE